MIFLSMPLPKRVLQTSYLHPFLLRKCSKKPSWAWAWVHECHSPGPSQLGGARAAHEAGRPPGSSPDFDRRARGSAHPPGNPLFQREIPHSIRENLNSTGRWTPDAWLCSPCPWVCRSDPGALTWRAKPRVLLGCVFLFCELPDECCQIPRSTGSSDQGSEREARVPCVVTR